ncbi:hypothetical protein Pcinc_040468 [Petrolisthes cinctipes]|nr:hypothetical protein Pcinc_040468 [Petrolisthes cinctipes]
MATLFSQVAVSSPSSASPKMMDVFFFYSILRLLYTFLHHSIYFHLQRNTHTDTQQQQQDKDTHTDTQQQQDNNHTHTQQQRQNNKDTDTHTRQQQQQIQYNMDTDTHTRQQQQQIQDNKNTQFRQQQQKQATSFSPWTKTGKINIKISSQFDEDIPELFVSGQSIPVSPPWFDTLFVKQEEIQPTTTTGTTATTSTTATTKEWDCIFNLCSQIVGYCLDIIGFGLFGYFMLYPSRKMGEEMDGC